MKKLFSYVSLVLLAVFAGCNTIDSEFDKSEGKLDGPQGKGLDAIYLISGAVRSSTGVVVGGADVNIYKFGEDTPVGVSKADSDGNYGVVIPDDYLANEYYIVFSANNYKSVIKFIMDIPASGFGYTYNPVLTANNNPQYTIDLSAGAGIANVVGAGNYNPEETVNISATTETGFGFGGWFVQGETGVIGPISEERNVAFVARGDLNLTGEGESMGALLEINGIVRSGTSGPVIAAADLTLASSGTKFTSDENGRFTITAAIGDQIVASQWGYAQTTTSITSQNITVSMTPTITTPIQLRGIVFVDYEGEEIEPAIGATVYVIGTTNGTITDFDGNYSLTVASNAQLLVSWIGCVPQIINVQGRNQINVTLVEDKSVMINGTVTNVDGAPIEGVSVKTVGSNIVAVTDAEGKYTTTAPYDGQLEFSKEPEYLDKTVDVNFNSQVNVVLEYNPVIPRPIEISGTVMNKAGSYIPGVIVTNERTGESITTGYSSYSIDGLSTDVIVFSHEDYQEQRVAVNGTAVHNVVLAGKIIQVSGRVTNYLGQALTNVRISAAYTGNAVLSGSGGAYTINVENNDKLTYSLTGYNSQVKNVDKNTSINVQLGLPPITISGTVKDDYNEPVIGATILVKGTTTGTVTDLDGKFTIQGVDPNATLQVYFIGYYTQEIPVNGQTTFNIRLITIEDYIQSTITVVGTDAMQINSFSVYDLSSMRTYTTTTGSLYYEFPKNGSITVSANGYISKTVNVTSSTTQVMLTAQSQIKIVSGRVTNQISRPVAGVTVRDNTTGNTTLTDANGNYTIEAYENGRLYFTYSTWAQQSVAIQGQSTINVTLQDPSIQIVTVKGNVYDDYDVVIGATVLVKGTTNGIITDLDGNYTLSNVSTSDTLVFSFIGYKTQEIRVGNYQIVNGVVTINVKFEEDYD